MRNFLRLHEGWLTVGLLALLLFSVTLSIQQAQWSDGLTILTPVTLVGLGTGLFVAKARGVPRFLLDLLGLEIGLVTVLLSVASIMRDPRFLTVQDRVQDLLSRTAMWVGVALRQDVSDDLLVFNLSLAVVSWVLAYSSAYFVFRSRQLWWALIPNGVGLLINLSYSPVNLNAYIVVFMFSALLLMIRFNLLAKEEHWQRERVNYSPSLTWGFLWTGSALSVSIALVMWLVPATPVNGTLSSIWDRVNKPWVDFQTSMSRLWSQVPGNQTIGGYSSFSKQFTMGGSLNLSDALALRVQSKERHYWRATTYDQYSGTGWRDTATDSFGVPNLSPRLALEANQQLISQDLSRHEVTYTVQLLSPKVDTIFASSRPVRLSTATRLEVSWRKINQVFSVDKLYSGSGGPDLSTIPLELRELVGMLREAQIEMRERPGIPALDPQQSLAESQNASRLEAKRDELSKRGINVTFDISPGPDYRVDVRAFGEIPVYEDITGIHAVEPFRRNDQYTVVSLISDAPEESLRAAGSNYESWLTTRYSSMPESMPVPARRVRELAKTIADGAGATNPYDIAKAVEAYLRANFKYSTTISQPPPGVDRVEWFLFTYKQGYCEYYATSMIVMLRSLGIPARLATGYAPGVYDSVTKAFQVKESAAHAWPEVYFPGYGWIEFEPTPSQAVITHDVSTPSQQEEPTAGPAASPTSADDLLQKDRITGENKPADNSGIGQDARGAVAGWIGILAAVLFVVAAVTYVRLGKESRLGRIAGANFYYSRVVRWARLLSLSVGSNQTPYELGETVAREVPGSGTLVRTISRAYVLERYSDRPLHDDERQAAYRAWGRLRRILWRRLPSRGYRRRR